MHALDPKTSEDPTLGEKCPACNQPFVLGDTTTLIPLGPGDREQERRAAREGRGYHAVTVEVHYACATGFLPPYADEKGL